MGGGVGLWIVGFYRENVVLVGEIGGCEVGGDSDVVDIDLVLNDWLISFVGDWLVVWYVWIGRLSSLLV